MNPLKLSTALTAMATLVLLAASAVQAATTVIIPRSADYINPDLVADNIKNECSLPLQQSDLLKESLTELGFDVQVEKGAEVPPQGVYIKIGIVNAVSMGNAFMGHRKQVSVSAVLYIDGAEVAKTSKTRDSMGGFGAGFKGSCSVLGRCCKALGKDVAAWARDQISQHESSGE